MIPTNMRDAVTAIAEIFRTHTGQTLCDSRLWRVETSVKHLLGEHGFTDVGQLVGELRRQPKGALHDSLIDSLINNESSFFRDLSVFNTIENRVLPYLNRTLPNRQLRIWSAGCSTGQEAYSLAMLLRRQAEMWRGWNISIIGTDISVRAITKARSGIYEQIDVQRGLPITDLLRNFEPIAEHWRILPEIRSMVGFTTDNIMEPRAVTGQFDLILCRNVMFYFQPEQRTQAQSTLAAHARPETFLILGAGETTIGTSNLFEPREDFRGTYRPIRPDHFRDETPLSAVG